MATPEGRIKAKLDRMLKAERVTYFSPQAGPYGTSGVHDRIAIVCGLFVSIECKADKSKKMTALQEKWRDKVVAAGGIFFLVYDDVSIETVKQFIHLVKSYARSRGSEGSHSLFPGKRDYSQRNSIGDTSETKPCRRSPPAGRNKSPQEPRP